MTLFAELERVRDALVDDDAAAALVIALAAWRAVPAAALAEAVDAIGARAAHGHHPPGGVSDEDRERAWHAVAAIDDPVARHHLLATVTDAVDPGAQARRIAALVPYRDPRVAAKLVALVESPQVSPVHHVPEYWKPLFGMLERCGDPRVRARVAAIDWKARATRRELALEARIVRLSQRLAERYPEPPPELPAEASALLVAIGALARAPLPSAARDAALEAELLRAVHATPSDDGPRAIYADWLQEHGDPRGEFIALQLATQHLGKHEQTDDTRRATMLLAQHRARWLGALAPLIQDATFRRGFLEHVMLRPGVTPPEDPAWGTVTKIRRGLPATDACPMPGLTIAWDLGVDGMLRLGALASPPPLVELGWRSDGADWSPTSGYREATRGAIDAFARVLPRLPLRTLVLDGSEDWVTNRMTPEQLAWPWRGTSIRILTVSAHLAQLPAWFAAAQDSQLDALTINGRGTHNWRIELSRDASGALANLEVINPYPDDAFAEHVGYLCDAMDVLAPDQLQAMRFQVGSRASWLLPSRKRMAAALDRHPSLRHELAGFTRPKR